MIRLSIVIPVIAEMTLIESLMMQSVDDFEVICVASSDADIDFSDRNDARIRVVNSSNNTVGGLIGDGIRAAEGEYVCVLRPDCKLFDHSLEALMNKVSRYDVDVIRFAYAVVDVVSGDTVDDNDCYLYKVRPGDFHRNITLQDLVINEINKEIWTGIYRRSYLIENNIRPQDSDVLFDRCFYYETYGAGGNTYISRDFLYMCNTEDRVSLSSDYIDRSMSVIAGIDSYLNDLPLDQKTVDTIIENEITDLYSCLLYTASSSGLRKEFMLKALERSDKTPRLNVEKLLQKIDAKYHDQTPVRHEKVAFFHEECSNPLVSVVVPIFNQEEYLNEALSSLSRQSLEAMEFICVNDGSTDNSMTIYNEYANIDKRFILIDKENTGYGHSMNVGIDAAKGEYLGILEPDDYVDINMFSDLYKIAHDKDLDIVKADFNRFVVNPDGSTACKRNKLSSDKSYYNRVLCPGDEQKTFTFIMNTWSGIYKRDFLNKWGIRHNETPGASYQDNGFWFQTFARADRVYFVDKPYYMNRRDNPNSSMSSRGKLYCITEEYDFIKNWLNQDPELWKRYEQIYYRKRFGNYVATFYRISSDLKKEYLSLFQKEFLPLVEGEKLDRSLYDDNSWLILNEIVDQGESYWDKIRVSIVLVVNDRDTNLCDCFDSLLARQDINCECIIIDIGPDGANDGLLQQYSGDARVKVLSRYGMKIGKALNEGLETASGEYLMFLNCNDVYDPEMIRLLYNFSRLNSSDIAVFRCDRFSEATYRSEPMSDLIHMDRLPKKRHFAVSDIEENVFDPINNDLWNKMFRKGFICDNHLRFRDDSDIPCISFVPASIVCAAKISIHGKTLTYHRCDNDDPGINGTAYTNDLYDELCCLREQLQNKGVYEQYERDFINYSLNISLKALSSVEGQSYDDLYNVIKNEWWDDLGIVKKPENYYYSSEDYDLCQAVMNMAAEDYRSFRNDQGRRKELQTKKKSQDDTGKIRESKYSKLKKRLQRYKRKIFGKQ